MGVAERIGISSGKQIAAKLPDKEQLEALIAGAQKILDSLGTALDGRKVQITVTIPMKGETDGQ